MRGMNRILIGCGLAAIAAAGIAAQAQQQQGGGTVTYWMSAETSSGMAAAMAGGAGQPDPQAMMRAMMGGGRGQAAHAHNLILQLGSPRRPSGAPSAEHLPPAGLSAGASLPLLTPPQARPEPTGRPDLPPQMERVQGRILIYWGCGERARPGQPVVIDLARLQAGQAQGALAGADIRTMTPPSPGRSATYGEWPNERSQTRVPATGSLIGDHLVRGSYTPDIRFSLAAGQDFLAPVVLTASDAAASGAVPLAWRPIANAGGWFVSAMGGGRSGDMVIWTSSETQAAPMVMDYLAPDEVERLVRQRVLLPGSATSCTVPAEAARAMEGAMLSVAAFGPEANFSHPARPANAAASWRPEWTAKLRTRAHYMGLLGMDMARMMGEAQGGEEGGEAEPQPRERGRGLLRRGLGRVLGQ
jgi:hypothetical protein